MRDVEKMITIGLVWGITNSIMRKGALIWDQKLKKKSSTSSSSSKLHQNFITNYLVVYRIVPFLINLSASATFFAILSDSPISLAVPVTNATTFAATAVSAMILGEETRGRLADRSWLYVMLADDASLPTSFTGIFYSFISSSSTMFLSFGDSSTTLNYYEF
ncbi:hypothetical protein MKX01_032930 [Papaver californicum]|nr:hypothetical protein MKX01_032930 [Papaver californicum]